MSSNFDLNTTPPTDDVNVDGSVSYKIYYEKPSVQSNTVFQNTTQVRIYQHNSSESIFDDGATVAPKYEMTANGFKTQKTGGSLVSYQWDGGVLSRIGTNVSGESKEQPVPGREYIVRVSGWVDSTNIFQMGANHSDDAADDSNRDSSDSTKQRAANYTVANTSNSVTSSGTGAYLTKQLDGSDYLLTNTGGTAPAYIPSIEPVGTINTFQLVENTDTSGVFDWIVVVPDSNAINALTLTSNYTFTALERSPVRRRRRDIVKDFFKYGVCNGSNSNSNSRSVTLERSMDINLKSLTRSENKFMCC